MKKSMLNVITLALVLINLILSGLLTFSLVSTSKKTDNLITKIAQIIDLDVAGTTDSTATGSTTSGGVVSLENLEVIDVKNSDDTKITVSVTGSDGKTHYAVVSVALSLNKTSKDYEKKRTSIDSGMKLIVSEVYNVVSTYSYDKVSTNKTNMEQTLLTKLQDMFQSDIIYSVTFTQIIIQ